MQNNNNFIVIVIIAAGLLGGYIYHANISSELLISPPLNGKADDLKGFIDVGLSFPDKEIARINNFKIFGENPVVPDAGGRRNIFAPY